MLGKCAQAWLARAPPLVKLVCGFETAAQLSSVFRRDKVYRKCNLEQSPSPAIGGGPWRLQTSAASQEDEDPMVGEPEEGDCPQLSSRLLTSLVFLWRGDTDSQGALAVPRDVFTCHKQRGGGSCHLGLGLVINICRA